MTSEVYLVFIHNNGIKSYGGYFSTKRKAETVCEEWNRLYGNSSQFADWINVTSEKDDTFILKRTESY